MTYYLNFMGFNLVGGQCYMSNLIAEYLVWEDFVEDAKKFNVPYYMGIDSFLKEYKNAVYSCLTNLQ